MTKRKLKNLNGKRIPEPDRPQKVVRAKLNKAIYRTAIPGCARDKRRHNEVIKTDKILDQLTEALD